MRKESFVGPVIFMIVWMMMVWLQLFSPLLVPSPISVGKALWTIVSDTLVDDLSITLLRLTIGFGVGMVIGIPVGLVFGFFPRVNYCFGPLIDFFRSVPVTALFPLFLLFAGMGTTAIAVIVAFSSSLVLLVNTLYGVRNCKSARLMFLRSLEASPTQVLTMVVLPESLPHVTAGIRTSVSIGLIVVIVTEMFQGATNGLGMRIYDANLMFRTPEMYAWIFVVGLVGFLLNSLFVYLERHLVHWMGR